MKKVVVIWFMFLTFSYAYGQLEFTKKKRLLFVGAERIKGKQLVLGVYISPIDSFNLKLDIDILVDWKLKDSINAIVAIDKKSINDSLYSVVFHNEKLPAYRFCNDNGLEIFIVKEKYFKSYDSSKNITKESYYMRCMQIVLPKGKKYYVKHLPVMYEK